MSLSRNSTLAMGLSTVALLAVGSTAHAASTFTFNSGGLSVDSLGNDGTQGTFYDQATLTADSGTVNLSSPFTLNPVTFTVGPSSTNVYTSGATATEKIVVTETPSGSNSAQSFLDTFTVTSQSTADGDDLTITGAPSTFDFADGVLTITPITYTYNSNTSPTPDFQATASFSPAPEPSQIGMLALMGLGLGGLMLRARKVKAALA